MLEYFNSLSKDTLIDLLIASNNEVDTLCKYIKHKNAKIPIDDICNHDIFGKLIRCEVEDIVSTICRNRRLLDIPYNGNDITFNGIILASATDTPLMIACRIDNIPLCCKLIELGADVNLSNEHGRTILHWCCGNGSEEVCELLLKYGANVDKVNTFGDSPLLIACCYARLKIALLLIVNGIGIYREGK